MLKILLFLDQNLKAVDSSGLCMLISRMQTAQSYLNLDLVAKLFEGLLINLQEKNEHTNQLQKFSSKL